VSSPSSNTPERHEFKPVAAILAIAFPGAGHAYLGDKKRALFIAASILFLFFGGLFVGGITVVDRRENPEWFIGQAFVGPLAFITDAAHQRLFKVANARGEMRPALPSDGRGAVRSIGRVAELGTLSSALAGMLNAIVILDAGLRRPRRQDQHGGSP
jgi:hypothetical protein